jgi:hypothetical protein
VEHAVSARRTAPAVWILWTGDPDGGQMIHSIFTTRDAACHKLCDLVLRGQDLMSPKIERRVITDAAPINGTNADAVAEVIKAYRALKSAGKIDMARASLRPLEAALTRLAYPMALYPPGEPQERASNAVAPGVEARQARPVDLGDDPDGDLAGYDGRR